MENGSSLTAEARDRIQEIEKADILVGIPSFNNEKTIGYVVGAVQCGLAKYFPRVRSLILNSDGGSTDRTREIVERTGTWLEKDTIITRHPPQPTTSLSIRYSGIPGKGTALRAVLEAANLLNVRACVVLDSDLRSISPEWVELLAGPILAKGYDYVSPFYRRHKYDGTITNSIVYPLTRALYGLRVRQPIGGDFALGKRLVTSLLAKDVWGTDVARFGIDIWMTTNAINEGYKVCQSFLGAKIHDPKDPGSSLGPMFKQVVGTLFHLMSDYEDQWKASIYAKPTPMYGLRSEVCPEPVRVSPEPLIDKFRKGVAESRDYWLTFIPAERVGELEEASRLPLEEFSFSQTLWARTVYDFAVAYRQKWHCPPEERAELLESLVPIYLGRTASFVIETKEMPTYRAEQVIEGLCHEFEELRPYLVRRWNFNRIRCYSRERSHADSDEQEKRANVHPAEVVLSSA